MLTQPAFPAELRINPGLRRIPKAHSIIEKCLSSQVTAHGTYTPGAVIHQNGYMYMTTGEERVIYYCPEDHIIIKYGRYAALPPHENHEIEAAIYEALPDELRKYFAEIHLSRDQFVVQEYVPWIIDDVCAFLNTSAGKMAQAIGCYVDLIFSGLPGTISKTIFNPGNIGLTTKNNYWSFKILSWRPRN